MAIEITVPRLGWSMDEGTFGEWLKDDGDVVAAGDVLFTLESEKALQEVESIDAGILRIHPDAPREGDTVAVGTLLAWLLEEGEELPAITATAATTSAPANDSAPAPVVAQVAAESQTSASGNNVTRNSSRDLPRISPRAVRAARELGVDWTQLRGGGTSGRIRERDVRAAAETSSGRTPGPAHPAGPVRRAIAERMMESVRNTAAVTLTTRVDATNLIALRNQFKAVADGGPVPGYQDIVVKLLAVALRRHPVMNSRWTDAGIVQPKGIHIGIAVDTEAGLLVPVLRDVDRLQLREVAGRCRDLIERARQRRCTAEELQGGTFSVTNLGAFGVDAFTPLINPPETAVLGLGAIRREPVVLDDDRIVPREQMTLSLTFDHRITDGAPAARFLQTLAEGIENPSAWLIQ